MATEEQIRNYAHLLWEKAGRPEGRANEFWHAAEVELNAESESPDAPTEDTSSKPKEDHPPSDQDSKLTKSDTEQVGPSEWIEGSRPASTVIFELWAWPLPFQSSANWCPWWYSLYFQGWYK